jgi:hypothetical protein
MAENKVKESISSTNENRYVCWRRLRKAKENIFYLPLLFLLPLLIVYFLPKQLPLLIPSLIMILGIFLLFIYLVIALFPSLVFRKKYLSETYKGASLYLIDTASRELENNDKLRVSFAISNLLLSLHDYLGQVVFKLGKDRYAQNKLLYIAPISIKGRHILKYMQAANQESKLIIMLSQLSSALNTDKEVDHRVIQDFLLSVFNEVESISAAARKQDFEETAKYLALIFQFIMFAFSIPKPF